MLKKLFSSSLIVSLLLMILPSSAFAVAETKYMHLYDGNGIQTNSFVIGEKINIYGNCPVLGEEGASNIAYIMPGGVDELTSYSGNLRSFEIPSPVYSDVEAMSSAVEGEFQIAIDTDGSGSATASDCYSEMFVVNEYGFSTVDSDGNEVNKYFTGDDVYVAGSCYPNEEYGVYITVNEEWSDSEDPVVSGDYTFSVSTDAEGSFDLTKVFNSLVTAAEYDVLLDRLGEGETKYNSADDCVLGASEIGFKVYNSTSTVTASLAETNPEDRTLAYTADEVSELILAFDLTVEGDASPILDAFNFVALGTADDSKLGTVELVLDENANGIVDGEEVVINSGSFSADNGKLRLEKPAEAGDWELEVGGAYNFLVFYTFDMDDFENEDSLVLKLESVDMRAPYGDGLISLQVRGDLPLISNILSLEIPTVDDGSDSDEGDAEEVDVAPEFGDIAGHPDETYIEDLRLRGVVNGKSEGVFAPNDLLNRAELSKMTSIAFGYEIPESVDEKPFPDVAVDQWYATYITVAKTEGIVNGYPDGTFKPAQNINRVEALKIVIESSGVDYAGAEEVSFPDTTEDWYSDYLNYAIKYDLADPYSSGDDAGLFKPAQDATRGEAAKMISQMMARVEALAE